MAPAGIANLGATGVPLVSERAVIKGNARFLRDIAQLFDYRQDAWYTIFASSLLGFPFGITGNQRAVSSATEHLSKLISVIEITVGVIL
jgi:hypothetical protein